MDKRVLRTKESIKTAFMQLTLENELEKITVSEIAEKAGINRSTFYLHYGDVSSVVSDIEREFAEEIAVCIDEFDISDVFNSAFKMFSYLTDELEKDELTKKYLIFSADAVNVANRIKHVLVDRTIVGLAETYPDLDAEKIVYSLTYAAAGLVESYVRWVKSGDKASVSLEELVRELSVYTEKVISTVTANYR